jgi:hypothetical protein
MGLYRYMPDINTFEHIVFKDDINLDENMNFCSLFWQGTFIGDKLKTNELAQKVIFYLQTDIPAEFQHERDGIVMGDFVFFISSNIPFLNEKSYQVLQKFVDPFCEVIPFTFQ